MTRPTEEQTSESAFYNFEVGDIVEKIRGSGSVRVSALCVSERRPVCPTGLDSDGGHGRGLERCWRFSKNLIRVFNSGSSHRIMIVM